MNNNYYDAFIKMCEGMIKKDRNLLEESMSDKAILIHMTGKRETREEYILDILDGTLNYYDYEIIEFNDNSAIIKLLARVYGGSKSWWRLRMNIKYEEIEKKQK